MEISVHQQLIDFLLSMVLGGMICLVFDGFRILRRGIPHHFIAVLGEDLLTFCIASAASYLFMMTASSGEVRLYILLGELLGFILWRLTLGDLLVRFFGKIAATVWGWIRRGVLALWKTIRKISAHFKQKRNISRKKSEKRPKKPRKNQKNLLQSNATLQYNDVGTPPTRGRYVRRKSSGA
ncbi:MAG: spore cortex biosynthesis protein YabQ [Oscillospiraceae bacterium]|nr:spore cortex biosynthesis protein YabQ [Oscillospiraceae bacterium]